MTQERFQLIKDDFVKTYGKLLCEDSMFDINQANDWRSFVDVLRKYMVFNNYIPFPDVEWARKWFADDKQSLNDESIYLDQSVTVQDPEQYVMCYGSCSGTAIFRKAGRYRIMLQDTSKLNLLVYSVSVVFVKLKGDAEAKDFFKATGAQIKVRRYENKNEVKWC